MTRGSRRPLREERKYIPPHTRGGKQVRGQWRRTYVAREESQTPRRLTYKTASPGIPQLPPALGERVDVGRVISLEVNPVEAWKSLAERTYGAKTAYIAIREAWQNARDAIVMSGQPGKAQLVINKDARAAIFVDTGPGMDVPTLLDKFLTLGESGKRKAAKAVGGFGVAKAVILAPGGGGC